MRLLLTSTNPCKSQIGVLSDPTRFAVFIGATGVPGAVPQDTVMFETVGVRMETRDDIDVIVWNKLAMASAMAAMTAITRLDIGRVLDAPGAVAVMKEMTREIVEVARAKGLDLDLDDALKRQFATYETARGHYPSMLQDVLAGRRTEIDALCGAVVREGEEVGVDTPVNRTIWNLILSVEGNYDHLLLGGGS